MSALRLPPLMSIRDIVKLYKLSAIKRLSQNFLLDEKLTDKLVKKAGHLSDYHVLEVGPGPGGLTRSIMKHYPRKITVIEKDKRFQPALEMLAESFQVVNGKMDILYGDIMKVDLNNIFYEDEKRNWEDKPPKIHLIGNLPFSVSTPLIIKWLHAIAEKRGPWAHGRTRMTLTFQREVADRLIALESGQQRCRLSVMAQAWTYPMLRFIIPGSAFVPKPEVDVGVVTFAPLVTPHTNHDFKLFEKVTRHIFAFRQKYNWKCVGTLFPLECRKEMSLTMYKLAELDPIMKSTQLSVQEVDRLVSAYKYLLEKHPEFALYDYRASRKVLNPKETNVLHISECI